jgi:hypothetical protein
MPVNHATCSEADVKAMHRFDLLCAPGNGKLAGRHGWKRQW